MRLVLYLVSISIYVSLIDSTIYTNLKDNVLSLLKRSLGDTRQDAKQIDYKAIKAKKVVADQPVTSHPKGGGNLKRARVPPNRKYMLKRHINAFKKENMFETGKYEKDPIMNLMSRRSLMKVDSVSSQSSSLEMQDWKDSWKEHWLEKKFEAINSTQPRGDVVNMLAARPWGVPCGDPNQHDMPWGSCMLPMECEAELRIYRGDIFCGRTQFVCCALQITTYDMYQGFDNSFEDSMLATSSEEKRVRDRGSKETKRRKKALQKKERKQERTRRKRKIKRTIKKIVREIRRILSRMYRNGTNARKRKTKQLKKFVKYMKTQYKKDRNVVKKMHIDTVKDIDTTLQNRLEKVIGMNKQYSLNSTFRDNIVNGTVNAEALRMLMKDYPEIRSMLRAKRRSNIDYGEGEENLNYDVEYGLLYY